MVFENGVKNIQAAAYNGARTVYTNFYGTQNCEQLRKIPFVVVVVSYVVLKQLFEQICTAVSFCSSRQAVVDIDSLGD